MVLANIRCRNPNAGEDGKVKNWHRRVLVLGVILLILGAFGAGAVAAAPEQVIKITAKKFEYNPREITLKQGVPVVLEFTSLDRLHGFNCPELGIRADIKPGKATKLSLNPQKVGDFEFHCDNFCGSGHSNMTGMFHVVE
jgi:cytochrome c oxidase subunit 2